MNKKICIVGIGTDGKKTLTKEGFEAIEASELIIGSKRAVEIFSYLNKSFFVSYKTDEIVSYIKNCEYEKITVLMSGDTGFFSGAEKLISALDGFDFKVFCGISSVNYFCSKIGLSWENMRFLSLHGRDGNIVRTVSSNEKTFFLLGGKITAGDICARLCEYGMNDLDIFIGEDLSGKNEKIIKGKPKCFTEINTDSLCVMAAVNPCFERCVRSGIPDDEFIRSEKIPMTKSEIRSVIISKLDIGKNDICWDIGGGTGSVSVEMALKCADGKVYSVEKEETAIDFIDANRHKFHCDNIEIIHKNAPEEIMDLPSPDCVFIGGAGGKLNKIIPFILEKNSLARIVLTAVTLETLNDGTSVFEKNGMKTEIIELAVTRTKRIGKYTMLSSENPVFLIKGCAK